MFVYLQNNLKVQTIYNKIVWHSLSSSYPVPVVWSHYRKRQLFEMGSVCISDKEFFRWTQLTLIPKKFGVFCFCSLKYCVCRGGIGRRGLSNPKSGWNGENRRKVCELSQYSNSLKNQPRHLRVRVPPTHTNTGIGTAWVVTTLAALKSDRFKSDILHDVLWNIYL